MGDVENGELLVCSFALAVMALYCCFSDLNGHPVKESAGRVFPLWFWVFALILSSAGIARSVRPLLQI